MLSLAAGGECEDEAESEEVSVNRDLIDKGETEKRKEMLGCAAWARSKGGARQRGTSEAVKVTPTRAFEETTDQDQVSKYAGSDYRIQRMKI